MKLTIISPIGTWPAALKATRNQINKKSLIGITFCKILQGQSSGRRGMLISEIPKRIPWLWIFSFPNMKFWMIVPRKLTLGQRLMKAMKTGMSGGLMDPFCLHCLSKWNGIRGLIICQHAMFWLIKNCWLEIYRLWRIFYQETMISSQILGFYLLIQNHLRNSLIIKELKLLL